MLPSVSNLDFFCKGSVSSYLLVLEGGSPSYSKNKELILSLDLVLLAHSFDWHFSRSVGWLEQDGILQKQFLAN